jgi:hypothetical protein
MGKVEPIHHACRFNEIIAVVSATVKAGDLEIEMIGKREIRLKQDGRMVDLLQVVSFFVGRAVYYVAMVF